MIIPKSKSKTKKPIILPLKKTGLLIKPPNSEKIKSGYVILKKGEEMKEHTTHNREEIIIILEGRAKVIIEDEEREVKKNHLVFIPENKKHSLKNNYNKVLKYIYIVTPIFSKGGEENG